MNLDQCEQDVQDSIPMDPMQCRVNKPHTCQNVSLNKWDLKASDQQHGMQIYRPNDGLRVPQRRPHIPAEFYDSGCYGWYCPQKQVCPQGSFAEPSPKEQAMFDANFASNDWAVMNGGPPTCVGTKGLSENSYLGWAVPSNQSKPLWMTRDEMKSQHQTNQTNQTNGHQ